MPVDPLTHLLDRGALERRADELTHQSSLVADPVGLVLVTVAVEDDALVAAVATSVRCSLRAYDLCYRACTREIVVLAPGARADEAADLARRLQGAVAIGAPDAVVRFDVAGTEPGEPFELARLLARARAGEGVREPAGGSLRAA